MLPPRRQLLKIVVVSTPKTGNTWVRYLLAKIYRLPMRDLPADVSGFDWSAPGPRWIGQQHFFPAPAILESAATAGVVFVTTIRHPADVLVSLYHHVRRTGECSDRPSQPGFMQTDERGLATAAVAYVQHGFFQMLHLSITWLRTGVAHLVRYEELCARPVETLTKLCAQIEPTDSAAILWAACESEIGELRRANPEAANFFRRGGAGGWRQELSEEIKTILITQPPYPEQFRELGYSMDTLTEENQSRVWPLKNPFRGRDTFDDGSAIAPVLKQIFFQLPEELRHEFPNDVSTKPGSYFSWLNEPAHDAPAQKGEPLVITELAYCIYQSRDDLGARWPDIFGDDRWHFLAWFAEAGLVSYGLAEPFGAAIFHFPGEPAAARSVGFCLGDFGRFENGARASFAIVTAFASLPLDLQSLWRNPYWSGRGSFFDWLRSRSSEDTAIEITPPITNLGAHLYRIREDVRERFPDVYGADRKGFDIWLRTHAAQEYQLDPSLVKAESRRARPRKRPQFWRTFRLSVWSPRRDGVNTPPVI